jgi:hypothetical protein
MPNLPVIVPTPICPEPVTYPAATNHLSTTARVHVRVPADTPQPDATFHLWSAGNVRLNNLDLTIPAREAAELVKVMRGDERVSGIGAKHPIIRSVSIIRFDLSFFSVNQGPCLLPQFEVLTVKHLGEEGDDWKVRTAEWRTHR